MKQSEWKEWIVAVIVISTLVIICLTLLPKAIEKSEVVECLKLQTYSEQFNEFYLTKSESEMCESHDIVIHAPVLGKNYETK